MIYKYISIIFITLFIMLNTLEAGCGTCAADRNKSSKAFIEDIPRDGRVSGKTFASCGMCNFDTEDRTCGLSVKIGRNIYKVANVDIDEHLDSHAKDGFCNVVRIANVKGKVKKGKLYADSFSIQ